jgi:hypothetical protein
VNNFEVEKLSEHELLALAQFAKNNNLSVATVINRILSNTINAGALPQAIYPPFEVTVNSNSVSH